MPSQCSMRTVGMMGAAWLVTSGLVVAPGVPRTVKLMLHLPSLAPMPARGARSGRRSEALEPDHGIEAERACGQCGDEMVFHAQNLESPAAVATRRLRTGGRILLAATGIVGDSPTRKAEWLKGSRVKTLQPYNASTLQPSCKCSLRAVTSPARRRARATHRRVGRGSFRRRIAARCRGCVGR